MRRLALVFAIAACGGGNGVPDADLNAIDAVPPDADPTCAEWSFVSTPGASNLRLADPGATHYAQGRAVRFAYDLPLTACEQTSMGLIDYFGDDPLHPFITPYIWRQTGGTCT